MSETVELLTFLCDLYGELDSDKETETTWGKQLREQTHMTILRMLGNIK